MSKVVILNAGAINYDGQLDFTSIADNVVTYNQTAPEQLGERTAGATIVVTKELPMNAESIAQLPESVQMCVEAGTGYNNYDLAALASRGIALTNIPAYSTARVPTRPSC